MARRPSRRSDKANWNLTPLYKSGVSSDGAVPPGSGTTAFLLRGTEGIAEHAEGTRARWKAVHERCITGRLAAWKDGGLWYSTRPLIDVQRLIRTLAAARRQELSTNDVMKCAPLFLICIRGEYPSDEQIQEVLRKLKLVVNDN
jgi:hypothetical protein